MADNVASASSSSALSPNEQLLAAASAGDLPTIKSLLTTPPSDPSSSSSSAAPSALAQPWYESPTCLGWSALHFAAERGHTHVIKYLLRNGAIWNAVDIHGVTAGEVAWSGNWEGAYRALLDGESRGTCGTELYCFRLTSSLDSQSSEGVRQTLLLNALAERAEEQAGEARQEEEEGEAEDEEKAAESDVKYGSGDASGSVAQTGGDADTVMTLTAPANELANSNLAFLSSPLRFFTDEKGKERCLDQDDNMVMAGWETAIMRRSADALCKDFPPRYEVHDEDGERRTEGFRVLNIGYGLGIVDDFFQEYKPARHVIVEPHPDAINYFKSKAISMAEGVELIPKRWEDALLDPELGEFDVVYADPFAQDYRDLKKLFDLLPNVLNGRKARFSFFHGLAGTNRFL